MFRGRKTPQLKGCCAVAILGVAVTSCTPSFTRKGDSSQESSLTAFSAQSATQTQTQSSFKKMVRITPLQAAKIFERLGYEMRFGPFEILPALGPNIGGIDWIIRDHHNPVTTVEAHLTMNWITYQFADGWLREEFGTPKYFTGVNLQSFSFDRPYIPEIDDEKPGHIRDSIHEGEARWKEMMTRLFYDLFSRAPEAEEFEAIKETFVEAVKIQTEGNFGVAIGWLICIQGMVRTMEFWHVVG